MADGEWTRISCPSFSGTKSDSKQIHFNLKSFSVFVLSDLKENEEKSEESFCWDFQKASAEIFWI